MHLHFLDPYRSGHSPIHKLEARVKLVMTVAFILCAALTPAGAWPTYILLFAMVLAAEILSEVGVGYILKRSWLSIFFVLAALPLVFNVPGQAVFRIPLGGWTLSASLPGLERFLSIAAKSWISFQAAILLASTTTFPDLMVAMRAVRVPSLLVAIFGLMWRYLFVLADEAVRMTRARQARSGQSDQPGLKPGGSLSWRGRVAGGMVGSLFLRAFERSDRIYMAMLARGYDGEIRGEPLPVLSRDNWLILICGLIVLVALAAFTLLLWG
jgi:cobalt/nickel transport system permease protein